MAIHSSKPATGDCPLCAHPCLFGMCQPACLWCCAAPGRGGCCSHAGCCPVAHPLTCLRPTGTSSTPASSSTTAAWWPAPTRTRQTPTARSSSSPWTAPTTATASTPSLGRSRASSGTPRPQRSVLIGRTTQLWMAWQRWCRGLAVAWPPTDPPPHPTLPTWPPPLLAGDTIYNLSRFNELEVDDDDRPAHPPVLTRADVLWNPFDDLRPRVDRCGVWVGAPSHRQGDRAGAQGGHGMWEREGHTQCRRAAAGGGREGGGAVARCRTCACLQPASPACCCHGCRDAKEAEARGAEAAAAEAKRQSRKQGKNFALMSFGAPRWELPPPRSAPHITCVCCASRQTSQRPRSSCSPRCRPALTCWD